MTLELTDPQPVDCAEEILSPDVLAFLEVFDHVLGDRPNQLDRRRDDVQASADQLLDVRSADGANTEVWLSGNGAVAIHDLVEDAATAEISRSQVWQLIANQARLADTGETVTRELVARLLDEETERLRGEVGPALFAEHYRPARKLVGDLCLDEIFVDFLTLPAYELAK